jgi:hypothetical protein
LQVIAASSIPHRLLARLLLAWLVSLSASARAQNIREWKTGPAFRRELESTITRSLSQRPLREILSSVSQDAGVAIFLDRRINPDQLLEVSARDEPLQRLLSRIAEAAKAGTATVGPVVYIGPPDTASKLATVAAICRQQAGELSKDAKVRLLHVQPWKWEELSQPRELLDILAREARVRIENAETIGLDLWPAVNLPPLGWTDRLTLLLAGFGLTFEIVEQGTAVRLMPIPETVELVKGYPTQRAGSNLAAQLKRAVPNAKIRSEEGKIVIAGSQEDHEQIERLLAGQSIRTPGKTAPKGGEKRYTLTVANEPAGAVMRKVAETIGKELKYDTAVVERLQQHVQFSVKEVTLDELMVTTLKPLHLTYKVTDDALVIVSAD